MGTDLYKYGYPWTHTINLFALLLPLFHFPFFVISYFSSIILYQDYRKQWELTDLCKYGYSWTQIQSTSLLCYYLYFIFLYSIYLISRLLHFIQAIVEQLENICLDMHGYSWTIIQSTSLHCLTLSRSLVEI